MTVIHYEERFTALAAEANEAAAVVLQAIACLKTARNDAEVQHAEMYVGQSIAALEDAQHRLSMIHPWILQGLRRSA